MEVKEKVTKSVNGMDLPASSFLVVEDPTKVTTWHLAVKNASGVPQRGLCAAAWAALHSNHMGNPYQGPNKEEAIKKLTAIYHSQGWTMPGMSKTLFVQDKAGESWFLGIYSNNIEDKVDDILSKKSHQDFVQWANEKGVKPPIVVVHQPQFPSLVHLLSYLGLETGKLSVEKYNDNYKQMYKATMIAQTAAIGTKNGFVIVVGKVLPDKINLVKKIVDLDWGMSHGFIPLSKDGNIIEGYRSFEFTVAPLTLAANGVTAIGFSEAKMGDEVKDALPEEIKALLSEDEIDAATKKAHEVVRDLLASKTLETPTEEKTEQVEVQQPEYATLRANLAADFKLSDLEVALKTVTDKLVSQDALIVTLSKAVTDLTTLVVELKKSDDQKIADAFNKPHWPSFEKKEPTAEEKAKIEEIKSELPKQIVEKTDTKDNMLAWATSGIFGKQ